MFINNHEALWQATYLFFHFFSFHPLSVLLIYTKYWEYLWYVFILPAIIVYAT